MVDLIGLFINIVVVIGVVIGSHFAIKWFENRKKPLEKEQDIMVFEKKQQEVQEFVAPERREVVNNVYNFR